MTALVWDAAGERIFQTGVDRGVLYLHNGPAVAWNGLISVDESSLTERKSFYIDGVKYLENLTPGEFQGKLKAFTYPDEFESVIGVISPALGLSYHEQPFKSFDLSYRTKIGNDIDGVDFGYKIHLFYNLVAVPDDKSFGTLGDSDVSPFEFSWTLTGTPPNISGMKPTVHLSVDSTKTPPEILSLLENTIYGNGSGEPSLPSISEIAFMFGV